MTPSQRAALEQKRGVSATSKPRCDAYGTSRDISRETIPPRDYQRIADEVSVALETIALTGRRV